MGINRNGGTERPEAGRAYCCLPSAERRATMGVPKVRILARGPLASHDTSCLAKRRMQRLWILRCFLTHCRTGTACGRLKLSPFGAFQYSPARVWPVNAVPSKLIVHHRSCWCFQSMVEFSLPCFVTTDTIICTSQLTCQIFCCSTYFVVISSTDGLANAIRRSTMSSRTRRSYRSLTTFISI